MRMTIGFALLLAAAAPAAALAQQAPAAAAPGRYSTADTTIGTLLDDPAARAVLQRNLPELVASDQVAMARGMTLRAVQSFAPETITDAKLAMVDRELAALPAHR